MTRPTALRMRSSSPPVTREDFLAVTATVSNLNPVRCCCQAPDPDYLEGFRNFSVHKPARLASGGSLVALLENGTPPGLSVLGLVADAGNT